MSAAIHGNFRRIQFSQKGDLQRFRDIFSQMAMHFRIKNVHFGLLFCGFNTVKIGSLKNFWPYGILCLVLCAKADWPTDKGL